MAFNKHTLYPYPSGWYFILQSKQLKKKQIISKKISNRDVVLYRTEKNQVVCLDAYCPHMGAHLGHGGSIEGESIKCPFHGFCFDQKGSCTQTGYSSKPSPKTRIFSYPVKEMHNMIFIYFSDQNHAPSWDLPTWNQEKWMPILLTTKRIKSNPLETAENSVDIGHFYHTHGYDKVEVLSPLSTSGPFLTTKYKFVRSGNIFGNKQKTISTEIEINQHGLGFARVDAHILEYNLRSRHFVMPTVVNEHYIDLNLAVSIKKVNRKRDIHIALSLLPKQLVNWIINRAVFLEYQKDVALDYKIWENKIYVSPPTLAKGDGPIIQYRKWARQFIPQEDAI